MGLPSEVVLRYTLESDAGHFYSLRCGVRDLGLTQSF